MNAVIFLLGFSFFSGFSTILAPCIWPLLPVILSSTVEKKDHKRPVGIVLGIVAIFAVVTLFVSSAVQVLNIRSDVFRLVTVMVFIFFGLSLLFPSVNQATENFFLTISSFWRKKSDKGGGFKTGFIIGLSLGFVWLPFAGPILASITAITGTGHLNANSFLLTIAYVIGLGMPLFIFAYGGQQIFSRARFLNSYTNKIQKFFGCIMLLSALAIYTNFDIFIQNKLVNMFPQYSHMLLGTEMNTRVKTELKKLHQKNIEDKKVAK